jgi:hypothetical protein
MMETQCTKCSSPVTVPDDVGVAASKNCGKLEGRYCTDCKLPIPKPTDSCSGCGRSYAACQKRKRNQALWKIVWTFVYLSILILVLLLAGWLGGWPWWSIIFFG